MDGVAVFNYDDVIEVIGEDNAYYYADNDRIYSKMEEDVSYIVVKDA